MKKMKLLFAVIIGMVLAAGCASHPSWVNKRPPSDEIWGIGSSKLKNESLAQSEAIAQARREIAATIGIVTRSAFDSHNREAGSPENTVSSLFVDMVIREVSDARILSYTEVIARKRMSDGTWWALVSIKRDDFKKLITDTVRAEAARSAQTNAERAMSRLDAEIDRLR